MFKKILIFFTFILNIGISLQAMDSLKSKLKSNVKRVENYRVRKALKECYGLSEPSEELQVEIDKALDLLKMDRDGVVILTRDKLMNSYGATSQYFTYPKAMRKTGIISMPVVVIDGVKTHSFFERFGVPAQVGQLYHELGHVKHNHTGILSILFASLFGYFGSSIIDPVILKRLNISKKSWRSMLIGCCSSILFTRFITRNFERQADAFAINALHKQNNILATVLAFLFYLDNYYPAINFLYPWRSHPSYLNRARVIIEKLIENNIDLFALPIPASYEKKNEINTRFLVCLKHYFPDLYTQALEFHNNANISLDKSKVELDNDIEQDCINSINIKENRAQRVHTALKVMGAGIFLGGLAYWWYKG